MSQEQVRTIIKLINELEDRTEVAGISNYLKEKHRALRFLDGDTVKAELAVGRRVKLKDSTIRSRNSKAGRLSGKVGTVEKINRTKAVVLIDETKWTIPFSMLEVV